MTSGPSQKEASIEFFQPSLSQNDLATLQASALKRAHNHIAASAPSLSVASFSSIPSDKWLLSSATQKCVRLGQSAWAAVIANALHSIDPSYLPRRLPIIAMEDIGIADIALCVEVLYLCSGNKFRGSGSDAYQRGMARYLVSRLAITLKSRATCDAYCLSQSHADTPAMMPDLLAMDTQALTTIASDFSRPSLERMNCLRILGGISVREKGRYRTVSTCRPEALRQAAAGHNMPPVIEYLTSQARRSTGLAAMLPIVYDLVAREERIPVSIGRDFPYSVEPIQGVPACAYDMFSEVGRRVITRFRHEVRPIEEYISERAKTRSPQRLLNMALFHAESSRLNRYLASEPLNQLTDATEREEMRELGLSDPEDRHQLYSLIEDHSKWLCDIRRSTAAQWFRDE